MECILLGHKRLINALCEITGNMHPMEVLARWEMYEKIMARGGRDVSVWL